MTKILLVGDFSDDLDEGYKNVSHSLANWLEFDGQDVIRLNNKRMFTIEFWKTIVLSKPQIIHIIAQPTNASLFFTFLLHHYYPLPPIIVSALRPEKYLRNGNLSYLQRILLHVSHPDLLLMQNRKVAEIINKYGYLTAYLPNGVDLLKFIPVSTNQKYLLRNKYKLDINHPLVLSVGHLETARNLLALSSLVKENVQVLIAGSLYTGIDLSLIERLESEGLIILKGYYPHIEELYQMADCYVFPVPPGNSLSMPLSILEAMACNLPVITTRFTGLQNYFSEGNGFQYMDNTDELVNLVQKALNASVAPATREMVKEFSWQLLVREMENLYSYLIRSKS